MFAQTLKKDDWIAMITYDMRPRMLQDFTRTSEPSWPA